MHHLAYVGNRSVADIPRSVRVERSRDTHRRSTWPDGHLDFARCERGWWAERQLPLENRHPHQASHTRKGPRSEEHTSELQTLMRISYAAFYLKQNKQKHNK